MSAHPCRYSYVGGFDGTSNVLGGMCFGMKPMGTHAHSFVSAYVGLEDLKTRNIDVSVAEADAPRLLGDAMALMFCKSLVSARFMPERQIERTHTWWRIESLPWKVEWPHP